jgi:hypothetical protein
MIRHLPHPINAARSRRNGIMIEKLLAIDFQLEPWQAAFVQKLGALTNAKLTHRQEDVLEEIHARYFPQDTQQEGGQQ